MKIIRYVNKGDITIKFLDTHNHQTATTYQNFKLGKIKNPYDRTADGVGYLGVGDYMAVVDNKNTIEYLAWKNLMMRCYNEKIRYKFKSYQKCIVCDAWHSFQTFAEWYRQNYYTVGTERMHLDKDILFKNNKIGRASCRERV